MTLDAHLLTLFGDRLAPDGKLVRDNFRAWFGYSKVVDADGKPLVVYRGDFPNKTDFTGREDSRNLIQGNVFFSDMIAIGKFYIRNPHVNYRTNCMADVETLGEQDGLYRVYLALRNPLIVDANGESWCSIPSPRGLKCGGKTIQIDDLAALVRTRGKHDGLIVRNVLDQAGVGDQYIAFRPEQIKSSATNCGAFNPADPDMTDSRSTQLANAVRAKAEVAAAAPAVASARSAAGRRATRLPVV